MKRSGGHRLALATDQSGFALIITVTLLALLILVLVVLASLTRVETSIAGNSHRYAQARQNALFALNQAIGELQFHAGPDQRVTARAEISGADNNRYWTGVWHSAGGLRSWLVSGNENLPDVAPASDAVPNFEPSLGRLKKAPNASDFGPFDSPSNDSQRDAYVRSQFHLATSPDPTPAELLVGPRSAGDSPDSYVVAPLVDLKGTAPDGTPNAALGRYAWWVGDESVKASVAETESYNDVNFDDPTDDQDYSDEAIFPGTRKRIAQLALPRQRIESFFSGSSIDPSSSQGELRKVLTPAQLAFVTSGPSLARLQDRFHDFTVWSRGVLASPGGGLKRDLSKKTGLDPGLRDFLFGPVSPTTGLNIRPDFNPGTTDTLAAWSVAPPSGSSDLAPVFSLAPVLSEFHLNFDLQVAPAAWSGSVELWNPFNVVLRCSQPLEIVVPAPQVTVGSIVIPDGQVYVLRLNSSLFPVELQPGQIRQILVDQNNSTRQLVPVSSGYSEGEYYLRRTSDPAETYLADYAAPPEAFSDTLWKDAAKFASGFRLVDGTDDLNWLAHYDPRGPRVIGDGLIAQATTAATDLLRPANRIVVFDIPRQECVSVGELQHLGAKLPATATSSLPAFRIGQPWGDSFGALIDNGVFDDSFFSTVPLSNNHTDPSKWWVAGTPLPNTRIEIYNPVGIAPTSAADIVNLGVQTRATRLMVKGVFNVNSTSPDAWRAIVRGTKIVSWSYENEAVPDTDASSVGLAHAYFRLSQTAQFVGHALNLPPVTDTDTWTEGVRELTDPQIDGIADYISAHIRDAFPGLKKAGEPFHSVRDFVDSGILQAAINSVGGDDTINPPPIEWLSPACLTQAELLTSWAPFLQARSDTFLIRAYGEAINPVLLHDDGSVPPEAVEGRAWCEAVVQRVPDLVDPTGDVTANATSFGRRFVVTSFRWLSPSDI